MNYPSTDEPTWEINSPIDLDGSSIIELIEYHAIMEERCDEAIEHLENLQRKYYRSENPSLEPKAYDGRMRQGEVNPGVIFLETGVKERADVRISDMPRDQARVLADRIRGKVPKGLPNAARRFLLNRCEVEMGALYDTDSRIAILRYILKDLEDRIMNFRPATLEECRRKLIFISGVMMDGREVDAFDIGFMLDHCAAQIGEVTGAC